MKTDFLKGLGLEQDQIDKIMAENGKDIAAEQAKTQKAEGERDNYKSQLDTATSELDKFKDVKPEEMQATIDQLRKDLETKDKEYADKESERIFMDSVKDAVKTAGGRNEKAVIAMLDLAALKESKNQSEDIKTALENVKKSDGYLFGVSEPINNPVGPTNGGAGGVDATTAAMRAAAGLPPAKE